MWYVNDTVQNMTDHQIYLHNIYPSLHLLTIVNLTMNFNNTQLQCSTTDVKSNAIYIYIEGK